MSIGTVIVTYRTPIDQLQRCLNGLRQNNIVDHKIITNDANNIGFAAAANLGAKQLSNNLLLFINPDAILSPRSIHIPVNYLSTHPTVGIVGPLLYNNNHLFEPHCYGQPVTLWSLFRRRLTLNRPPAHAQSVGWVTGGAMLVRRSVFQTLSGFDPEFFLYWEDVDLCHRSRQAGYAVHLLPSWRVFHQRGASLSDHALKTRLYDQSADNFFRKHYSKPIWLFQRYLRWFYRLLSPLVD